MKNLGKQIDLGYASATGKDAIGECNAFAVYIRVHLGPDPQGCMLQIAEKDNRLMVQAVYSDNTAWADKVNALAQAAWKWAQNPKPEPLVDVNEITECLKCRNVE